MSTTFTNGRVALTNDLVFGLSVLSQDGWVPFRFLEEPDKELVRRLLAHNPTCPRAWRDEIYAKTEAVQALE
jgi:hypothetical protein